MMKLELALPEALPGAQDILLLESHVRLLHAVDLFANKLHFANLSRD